MSHWVGEKKGLEKQMLHIVQVVLSGIAEIPRLLFDEGKAQSAYVECAKEYWAKSYSAYCEQNGASMDCFSSAKAFVNTFDSAEKSNIYYWIVKPKDMGLDKLDLHLPGTELIKECREHIQQPGSPEGDAGLPSSILPQEEAKEIDEKFSTPEWKEYVEFIKNISGGSRSEFHLFTRNDWRQDVYSNSTSFEYWDWVAAKIDSCIEKAKNAGCSVFEDSDHPGQYKFKTPDGIVSEFSCNTEGEAWCHAGLHLDG
jgi:hypothetical protein